MSGDEFTAKCEAAALELDALADQHGYPNNTRLRGKAQGVRLALSYLRDYPTADAVLAVPAIADALADVEVYWTALGLACSDGWSDGASAMQSYIETARDHIAALRAVDDSDIVPGSEFDGPVIL